MKSAGGWCVHLLEWFVAGIGLTLGYRFTGWLVSKLAEMFSGGN